LDLPSSFEIPQLHYSIWKDSMSNQIYELIQNEQKILENQKTFEHPSCDNLTFNSSSSTYHIRIHGLIVSNFYPKLFLHRNDTPHISTFITHLKIKWIDDYGIESEFDYLPIQDLVKPFKRLQYYIFKKSKSNPRFYKAKVKRGLEVKARTLYLDIDYKAVLENLDILYTPPLQLYNRNLHCIHFVLDTLYFLLNIRKLVNLDKTYKYNDIYIELRKQNIPIIKKTENRRNRYIPNSLSIAFIKPIQSRNIEVEHVCLIYRNYIFELDYSLYNLKLVGYEIVDQIFIKPKFYRRILE
jgi:hypothetical protein